MTGPTHLTFAVASSLALVQTLNPHLKWHYLAAILLGALAPDLDAQRSSIHSPSRVLKYILPKFAIQLIDESTRLFSKIIRLLVSHRGVLHSPLVGINILCASYSLNSSTLFWFAFAYCGHILLDYCTAGGIPFFSPFSRKTFSALPIKTGSFAETMVCAGLLWYIAISIATYIGFLDFDLHSATTKAQEILSTQ